ncbi:MAG: glycosyltransferase family 1 protein [Sideroxyarcus sp.]|nr:glycosyltransferase family 1 protein [Sideroxyarcus sp.]
MRGSASGLHWRKSCSVSGRSATHSVSRKQNMNIGIDCRNMLSPGHGEQAGIGHYTSYVVHSLLAYDQKNTYVLFFDHRAPDLSAFQRFSNVQIRHLPLSKYKKFLPIAYAHAVVPQVISRADLDVFHAPANILPLGYNKPSVITIHDLAIYREPSWFPRQALSTGVLVPRSLRQANRIIAVSQFTAQDITSLFHISPQKIQVIHEGVEQFTVPVKAAQHAKKHFAIRKPYFFFVGTLEPRKNLPHAIRAYAAFVRDGEKLAQHTEFLIAGAKGFHAEEIATTIRKEGMEDKVRVLGYVSHEEKLALIKGAAAFIFPSLYEGFGLPILEAMQLGTPVIASDTSSITEIVGRAGILVDPKNVEELAQAMGSLLMNTKLRRELISSGKRKATQFTWEQTARETLKVYEQVVRNTRRA